MTVLPWWEQHPGLLQWELDELDAVGIRYEVLDSNGGLEPIRIAVWPVVDGVERSLVATFPDNYPWFRPEVVSAEEGLDKHQGRNEKNLCLLDRPAHAWRAASDSLARLLVDQLPKVYASQGTQHPALEVPQPEPFTAWFDYWPAGGFVVDTEWDLGDADGGTFTCALFSPRLPDVERRPRLTDVDHRDRFSGIVLSVRDDHGKQIAAVPAEVQARCGGLTLEGRWVRMDETLTTSDPAEARQQIAEASTIVGVARPGQSKALPGLSVDVVAAVVAIQRDYDGATVDGWLFIATLQQLGRERQRGRVAPAPKPAVHHFVRGVPGGRRDLAERIPQLAPLRKKKVAIFGLGGVGAPSAVELAKAQVAEIRLVDHDAVELGPSVRNTIGLIEAGRSKVAAVGDHIANHQPFVNIYLSGMRLGAVRIETGHETQLTELDRVLDGVDLIYDATGDYGVSAYLCDLAFQRAIPFLVASTSIGGWGGRIAVFQPGEGPCIGCLQLHVAEQDGQVLPFDECLIPPSDPNGEIRAVGCADATFTAAGFDVLSVAAAGARLAAATLCGSAADAYPAPAWNVAVMRFRDEQGRPLAGESAHHMIDRRADCPECQRRSG